MELSWCQRLKLQSAGEVDYGGLATDAVDAQCTRLIVLSMKVIVADRRGRRATVERLWSIEDVEDQDEQ